MAKFNLGILKNIGFKLANDKNKDVENSYYVLSDVDLLPSNELLKDYLKYPDTPIHLGNKGTRYLGNADSFLGGVLSVNKEDFLKSNGYPNNFWGWGGEDDALKRRLDRNDIKIQRPEGSVSKLNTFRDGLLITKTILRLLNDYKPLLIFSIATLVQLVLGILLFIPILEQFMITGMVDRFPTAFLSLGLIILSVMSFFTGLILDGITRSRLENKKIALLQSSK